jgi:hypothetical protein
VRAVIVVIDDGRDSSSLSLISNKFSTDSFEIDSGSDFTTLDTKVMDVRVVVAVRTEGKVAKLLLSREIAVTAGGRAFGREERLLLAALIVEIRESLQKAT